MISNAFTDISLNLETLFGIVIIKYMVNPIDAHCFLLTRYIIFLM